MKPREIDSTKNSKIQVLYFSHNAHYSVFYCVAICYIQTLQLKFLELIRKMKARVITCLLLNGSLLLRYI